jgi:hypothetical protein
MSPKNRLGWGVALVGWSLVGCANAIAGTTTASIQSIRMNSAANVVYVYPTGGTTNAPSCHSVSGPSYYSFSMSRPMAKEYVAALLAAHARGTPVTLIGSGTCQDEPNSETLDSLTVS